jgi:hypothetical protein
MAVDEPQRRESLGGTATAGEKPCLEALARFVGQVREHLLTTLAGETGRGPVDGALHGEPTVAVDEVEEYLGFCSCRIREDSDP